MAVKGRGLKCCTVSGAIAASWSTALAVRTAVAVEKLPHDSMPATVAPIALAASATETGQNCPECSATAIVCAPGESGVCGALM